MKFKVGDYITLINPRRFWDKNKDRVYMIEELFSPVLPPFDGHFRVSGRDGNGNYHSSIYMRDCEVRLSTEEEIINEQLKRLSE